MFNKRELKFRKNWIKGATGYSTIKDNILIETILELANYYNLKIKKVFVNDILTCKIILNGDKKTYLIFVNKLLNKIGDYLTEIRF